MRWLVDGYNVIRRDPDLRAEEERSLDSGRKALIRLLSDAASGTDDTFTVVFDGAPGPRPSGSPGRIEVVFSRPPETADDVLRRLATRWREAAIVVSSDRAVKDATRRLHAVSVDSDDFVAALVTGGSVGSDDDVESEDADQGGGAAPRRGNPRRLSRDERAARRALRRLARG